MPPLSPLILRRLPEAAAAISKSVSLAPSLSLPSSFSPASSPVLSLVGSRTPFSTASATRSGDAHGSHYDPPSGWLFGVPPGEKYKKEGWETIWVWGFWGSLGVAVVAYAFKPDTSIQTWALEEARRRLEAEGILPDPTNPAKPT